jgi:N-acetylneuraminic acid mutarotase
MLVAATVAAALAWTPLPSATLPRTEVAAARVGGSIYVAGGFVDGGNTTRAVERYDIGRRSWRRMRPMPVELNHAVAVAFRGRLYVSGGYRGHTGLSQPSRVLLRYNPRANRWRRLPPAPTPRAAHAAAVIRGRLYVAGGANDSGSLRSLEVYDFARRRWTSGPDLPGPPRNHTTGVATGGRFYVLAGRDAGNLAAAERYNPRTRRWHTLPDMATARGGIASARLRDGRIVVFGGEDFGGSGNETIAEVELFEPRTRRWSRLPDMRTPRHGLGGAALGNRVFALEGGPQPGLAFSDAIEFIDVPRRR